MPDPTSPKTYWIRRGASYRDGLARSRFRVRESVLGAANSNSSPHGGGRDGVGTAVRRRTLSRAMSDAFAPGGPLAATLPGFEPRAEQAALAAAVELALATGEHLVAEAGTGTGKSLGYLLPALESGRRVVVATATKALQEQLLAREVPAAARALGREVQRRRPERAARTTSAASSCWGSARCSSATPGTSRPSRRSSRGSRRPRPGIEPSCRSSRRRRSGPSSPWAPTAARDGTARSSPPASPRPRGRGRGRPSS